ncbi:hypothetical protein G5I73_002190 [Escherichia coli]|uniref:hypothetical protein n=1 Tax=Escherichia coli TaxID=562 RepID=UPI0012FFB0D5|nr:hypothetical protein [Escherichia coli]EFJ3312106.1 hypothetical protein [Escherichia coli]MBB8642361.1 hypothetical protein [Escherichia coli]HDW7503376.1 hypothetical protein [Escherichia coli]HEL5113014.1 hypothetical protein [Escherichia coli]
MAPTAYWYPPPGHWVDWWPQLKGALDIAFNEEGKQILPVPARISGQVEALNELLKSCGWIVLPEGDACLPHLFTLMTRQGVPGKDG